MDDQSDWALLGSVGFCAPARGRPGASGRSAQRAMDSDGAPPRPRVRGPAIASDSDPDDTRRQGLGLPLAKQLIEAHGGTFEIQSEKGAGTSVNLWLP